VQQTNCHPFRHGKWLWMHNGQIAGFGAVKRELVMAVDPTLYGSIEGSSDTEVFFYLALTFGLAEKPADRRTARGRVHRAYCRSTGIEHPMRMSVAASDGESLWAFRYSSEAFRRPCSTRPMCRRCASSIRSWKCFRD
jgi:glutamine amidotransferase